MVEPASTLPAPLSWLVVVVHAVLLGSSVVWCAWKTRRFGYETRRADHLEARTPVLTAGARVTLRGRARTADGSPALTVEIEQDGRDRVVRGQAITTWSETARRLVRAPFSLELADGTEVRVEGGEDVQLVDDLVPHRHEGARRVLRAAVDHGESVALTGRLGRAAGSARDQDDYRDGKLGWVLHIERGSWISTKHLGTGARVWLAFYRRMALWACIGLVLGQLTLAGSFTVLALRGEEVGARVVQRYETISRGRRGRRVEHHVVAEPLDPARREALSAVLSVDSFARVQVGDVILWQVVPGLPSLAQAGALPRMPTDPALVLVALTVLAGLLARARHQHIRPWWERTPLEQDEPRPR